MKIAVIGTGYVGLVSAACFAESGNEVVGIDKDANKIATLEGGQIPIYEPGLLELVSQNRRDGRLSFSTDLGQSIQSAEVIFIAVGTPQDSEGNPDLGSLWAVANAIAKSLNRPKTIVIKSTVPVGTNKKLADFLAKNARYPVDVTNNPEFLKEGTALDDFRNPDRVVVGVRRQEVAHLLQELYSPYTKPDRPFIVMSPESAEMTKYVANAMLATKISFINEMANLCEHLHADINDIRQGIGYDQRIGFRFLAPGAGWGGSCFPKDVQALMAMARHLNYPAEIMTAVHQVNERQKLRLPEKIHDHFGSEMAGKTLAIWGLAFKPNTDDIREAPSIPLIRELINYQVKLQVHDPQAMINIAKLFGDHLVYCEDPYDALKGADALAIVTEWQVYRHPDFERMHQLLLQPVIFDGRNLYDLDLMREKRFHYYSIGRQSV